MAVESLGKAIHAKSGALSKRVMVAVGLLNSHETRNSTTRTETEANCDENPPDRVDAAKAPWRWRLLDLFAR